MNNTSPLKAERFMSEIEKYFSKSKGTYLYDICLTDHADKISNSPTGYVPWLKKMLAYLTDSYNLTGKNIVDVGCGTGEFTVWMNRLGYNAVGVDVDKKFLDIAQILAGENNLPEGTFQHLSDGGKLPFPDKSIDVVTMFSVLEHIDDEILIKNITPELYRVCRGVIYILVPNKLKPSDDHTGLWFIPWVPRFLAEKYIKLRGKKYGYYISLSGEWDVYYRTWKKITSIFESNFKLVFPPDNVIYPPLEQAPVLSFIGKKIDIGFMRFNLGIPIPLRLISRVTKMPIEAFYRYLNFMLIPREKS